MLEYKLALSSEVMKQTIPINVFTTLMDQVIKIINFFYHYANDILGQVFKWKSYC